MNIFKKLFAPKQPSQSTLQKAQEIGGKLIVSGYRRIFTQADIGASPDMSDALILQIYSTVGGAFREVAASRGEHLKAGVINTIVLYFLENYRTNTRAFYESHLEYELKKYNAEGLRPSYQRETQLF